MSNTQLILGMTVVVVAVVLVVLWGPTIVGIDWWVFGHGAPPR